MKGPFKFNQRDDFHRKIYDLPARKKLISLTDKMS